MKTLTVLALIAASIAFASVLVNLEVAAPVLFAAGLFSVLMRDYTRRTTERLFARQRVQRSERFGLAA